MNAAPMSAQEIEKAVCDYASRLLSEGKPEPEVERTLINQGLHAGTVKAVLIRLRRERARQPVVSKMNHLIIGGLFNFGGIAAALATYATMTGGVALCFYVVAAIAMGYGFVQVALGLTRPTASSKPGPGYPLNLKRNENSDELCGSA